MKIVQFLRLLVAGALLACSAPASGQVFTSLTWGVNRASPTAAPVCLMKNGTCLIQIGTANLLTGAWTPSSGGSGSSVASVGSSNGSLTVSPTTGPVNLLLNPAHANSWSSPQTFGVGDIVLNGAGTGCAGFASGVLGPITCPTGGSAYPSFDLRAIFTAGGTDNGPLSVAWMATNPSGLYSLNSPNTVGGVEYYFSSPLDLANFGLNIDCGGGGFRADNVHLVFAAGVDGVIEDWGSTSDVRGCSIISLGIFASAGPITSGITVIPAVTSFAVTDLTVPFFAAGDGVIMLGGTKTDVALATPPGAYLASVSGATVTLATGFAVTTTPVYESAYLFRLPAANASTVTTTTGSTTVTTTGGPYLWVPGDLIWSDAFPYGTTVSTTLGSLGAQTLTMTNAYMDATVLATKTHTAGSGKMWLIPAAFKRRASGESHNVYEIGWPTGMQMSCTSGGSENCDNSRDYGFGSERSIVGRWVGGNNTGSSLSIGAFYNTSLRFGILEGGSLGSYYFGETYEGYESGTAYTDVVLNCNDSNNSTFFGYYQNSPNGSCGNSTDPYNTNPSNPTEGGTVKALSIGPTSVSIAGLPSLTGNALSGAFLYLDAAVAGGYIYNVVTIATLNTCSTYPGTTQVISNGIASPTYRQAVSTTGTTRQLVFCDGTSWTYH
jgi:hypothetical protein